MLEANMTRRIKKPVNTYKFPEGISESKNINQITDSEGSWSYSDSNNLFFGLAGKSATTDDEPVGSSAWQKISANFTQENNLFSGVSEFKTLFEMPDNLTPADTPENYNALEHIQGYEDHADTFAFAETPTDTEFFKRKIDKQRENKKIIAEGGWLNFVAGLSAGILDPINLIPVGSAARVTYKAGESFLKGAVATGRAGFLGSSLSEAMLHTTQETRTFGESAMNIAGGTLLSGVIGGSIGAYTSIKKLSKSRDELERLIENDFKVPDEGMDYLGGDKKNISKADLDHDTNIFKSVGAAAPNKTEAILKKMYGAEKFAFNPVLRTAASESTEARRASQLLADSGLRYEDNSLGIATPFAASTISDHLKDKVMTKVKGSLHKSYVSYKKRVGNLPIDQRPVVTDVYGVAFKDNLLNQDEFFSEVSKSLRRGEKHILPEVESVAKDCREEIDRLKNMAINAGLLGEEYRTANSNYLHRIYDTNKIKAKHDDFKRIVEDWLRGDADLALDSAELGDCANQIINRITGESPDRISYSGIMLTSKKRGPLKERVFNIPDVLIEEYLVNDIEAVMRKYTNTMASDITIKNLMGDVNGVDVLSKIKDDWDSKIRQIKVEDPDLPKRRSALLEQAKSPEERLFIEQATPEEVISRRQNLELLETKFNSDIKKFDQKLWDLENKNAVLKYDKKIKDLEVKGKTKEIKAIKEKLNKQIDINRKAQEKGLLPKLSDNLKKKRETIEAKYNQSREAILNAKPRSVESVEKINNSRNAELSALNKNDINYNSRVLDINNKYDDMISKLNVFDKDALKTIKKLEKKRDRDLSYIESLIGAIRGTLKKDSSSILDAYIMPKIGFIKTWNATRLLGQTMLSAIPDVGAIVFVNGFARTIGDVVLPFIRNINEIVRYKITGASKGLYFERRQELKDAGVGINEILLNNRADALADMGSQYSVSGLETYGRKFNRSASYWSGISWWNEKLKTMAAYAAQAKILRLSTKNKLSAKDIEDLAAYGVDAIMLKRIRDQFKQFGKKGNGVMVAGIGGWSDAEAADIFSLAVRKIVDNTILTPNLEKPLFFRTPLGSILGQFKGFGFGAFQRYFLAGIQRKDLAVMSGALSMMSLGMFSQIIKELYAYGEVKERTAEEWIAIGVEKSGLVGHLMDVENIISKFTGNIIGIDSMATGETKRDYNYGFNALKSLSATGSLLGDITEVLSGTANTLVNGEKVNGKLLSATRRLIPYQNSITFRKIFDATEDGLRDSYGIKARGQSSRSVIR